LLVSYRARTMPDRNGCNYTTLDKIGFCEDVL
jgi:hypothetical protein